MSYHFNFVFLFRIKSGWIIDWIGMFHLWQFNRSNSYQLCWNFQSLLSLITQIYFYDYSSLSLEKKLRHCFSHFGTNKISQVFSKLSSKERYFELPEIPGSNDWWPPYGDVNFYFLASKLKDCNLIWNLLSKFVFDICSNDMNSQIRRWFAFAVVLLWKVLLRTFWRMR